MALQIFRVAAVVLLLVAAAAIVTPRGRLPPALRGLVRLLASDRRQTAAPPAVSSGPIPIWKRSLAFAIVLLAVFLAVL